MIRENPKCYARRVTARLEHSGCGGATHILMCAFFFYSLILGETLSLYTFSGMALILAAIAVINMKRSASNAPGTFTGFVC